MGVQDLDARFDAVDTTPGHVADTAVQAIREAAATINDQVEGEPYQLVTVLQALETAAHQAGQHLAFVPSESPGVDPPPPVDEGRYADAKVPALRQELKDRKLDSSGTRPELVARLLEDDAQNG